MTIDRTVFEMWLEALRDFPRAKGRRIIPGGGYDRRLSHKWDGLRVCHHLGALTLCDMDCSAPPKAIPSPPSK